MSWTTSLWRVAFGLIAVADPQDGDGWHETALAALFIIGVFVLLCIGRDVPEWLIAIVSAAAGGYLGAKVEKHSPEK